MKVSPERDDVDPRLGSVLWLSGSGEYHHFKGYIYESMVVVPRLRDFSYRC